MWAIARRNEGRPAILGVVSVPVRQSVDRRAFDEIGRRQVGFAEIQTQHPLHGHGDLRQFAYAGMRHVSTEAARRGIQFILPSGRSALRGEKSSDARRASSLGSRSVRLHRITMVSFRSRNRSMTVRNPEVLPESTYGHGPQRDRETIRSHRKPAYQAPGCLRQECRASAVAIRP